MTSKIDPTTWVAGDTFELRLGVGLDFEDTDRVVTGTLVGDHLYKLMFSSEDQGFFRHVFENGVLNTDSIKYLRVWGKEEPVPEDTAFLPEETVVSSGTSYFIKYNMSNNMWMRLFLNSTHCHAVINGIWYGANGTKITGADLQNPLIVKNELLDALPGGSIIKAQGSLWLGGSGEYTKLRKVRIGDGFLLDMDLIVVSGGTYARTFVQESGDSLLFAEDLEIVSSMKLRKA